jgi:hypothetical protein
MTTGGVVYKDLLPIPDETVPEQQARTVTLTEKPTESHALAMEAAHNPEQLGVQAGAAQVDHAEEVVNLGWNEPKQAVANPLVGGLSNEDLWMNVRRFNKVSSPSERILLKEQY